MTFGEKAAQLAGFAASLLGWRPSEFWASTPAELATALGQDNGQAEQISPEAVERLRAQFPDNRGQ